MRFRTSVLVELNQTTTPLSALDVAAQKLLAVVA